MSCLVCGSRLPFFYVDEWGGLHGVLLQSTFGKDSQTCSVGMMEYLKEEVLVLLNRAKGRCPWCGNEPYHYGSCPAVAPRLSTGENPAAVVLRDKGYVLQLVREIEDGRVTVEAATKSTRGRWIFKRRNDETVAFYGSVEPPVERETYVLVITVPDGKAPRIGGYTLYPAGHCGVCGTKTDEIPCPTCGAA